MLAHASGQTQSAQVTGSDLFAAIAVGDQAGVRRILDSNPEAAKEMRAGLLPVHLAAARGELGILQGICHRDPAMLKAKARDGSSLVKISMEGAQHGVTAWLIRSYPRADWQEILDDAAVDALELYPRSLPTLFDAGWRPKSKENLLHLTGWILYLDDVELFEKIRPLGITAAIVWDMERRPDDPRDEDCVLRFLLPPPSPPKIPLRGESHAPSGSENRLDGFLRAHQAGRTLPLLIQLLFAEAPERDWGKTIQAAAMYAVLYGRPEQLDALLASGKLDINLATSEGTLLQIARARGRPQMTQWLLKKGAKEANH